MCVCDIFGELLCVYGMIGSCKVYCVCIVELMQFVGLLFVMVDCYLYEFFGGQRQCIGIVRVFVFELSLLICDEVVLVFDVLIQVQVINFFMDFQEKFGFFYFFIVYDFFVVCYISDCIVVMYLGKIVEMVMWCEFFESLQYFYIWVLFLVVLVLDFVVEVLCMFGFFEGEILSVMIFLLGCCFYMWCSVVCLECVIIEFLLQGVKVWQVVCYLVYFFLLID